MRCMKEFNKGSGGAAVCAGRQIGALGRFTAVQRSNRAGAVQGGSNSRRNKAGKKCMFEYNYC